MRNRILVPLVVLVLALAAAGTAAAATGVFESNDSGLDGARDVAERGTGVTQPTTSTPDSTLPDDDDVAGENRTEDASFVNLADGASQTFAAGQACSVTVERNGNALTVLSVNPASGFASEVEQSTGAEVEVQCLDGTTRVDFNAELEDGVVRVRVRVRAPDVPAAPETTVPDVPPTTPTTEPERVDNSGPGNAQDEIDDDHSGPGGGGDEIEDEPEDDSGHHGGGDDSGSDDSGHSGSGPG